MRTRRLQLAFALLSFASPFIALVGMSIYQDYRDAEFWQAVMSIQDDANNSAGAMMAIGNFIEWVLAGLCGSCVGLFLAAISLRGRWKRLNLAWFAAAFNLLPFIAYGLLLLRRTF